MNDKRNNLIKNSLNFNSQSDIDVLSTAFSLPEINYIDISRQEHLAQVIARWPLLAELAEQNGSNT